MPFRPRVLSQIRLAMVAALLGEGAAMVRLTPVGVTGGAIASVLAVRTGLAADPDRKSVV